MWIDGCYDMTHFGHFNAFRQAKALGDYLIVGLNPDKEVVRYKGGAPLMTEAERLQVANHPLPLSAVSNVTPCETGAAGMCKKPSSLPSLPPSLRPRS